MSKTDQQENKELTPLARAKHVEQMNANMGLDGLKPDKQDRDLQARYVEGKVDINDMLKSARDYAERSKDRER